MNETNGFAETMMPEVLRPSEPLGALVYAVIIGLFAWLVGRALHLAINRVLTRPKHIPSDPTAVRFLGQLARVGVYIFAFLTYAHLIPALRSIGDAWLASVGVASVVIGLAAQNTLGNLIAGISLLLYRPFSIGDRLQVTAPTGLETGVVESLNLGYTVLRTSDQRRVVIPNSAMTAQTSVNLSSGGTRTICSVPVTITPDADLDHVRALLIEIVKQLPKAHEYIGSPVTAIGNASVTLTVRVWCADYQDAADLKGDLFEAIRKRFKAEGIELR